MRSVLLLGFFSLLLSPAFSQDIKGVLKTSASEALPNATITLHRAKDSTLLRTTVSAANGSFSFDYSDTVPLLLQIASVGHTSKWLPVGDLQLNPVIVLDRSTKSLEAIVVTAKKTRCGS